MSCELWQIILVSLKVALLATLLVMICAIVLAIILVRSRLKWFKALELAIYLPMTMPPVALGYGLLLLLGPGSLVGRSIHNLFGFDLAFTFAGAVIASFAVSLGIGLRSMRVALEGIDESQCHIGALLGGSAAKIFFHIILPQCRPAIFGGSILVFMRSLSEFGATMVLAGNVSGETRTLALAIWLAMETPGRERECFVLVIIAAVISAAALVATEILLPRE
jgi:molybdate transport system permease protein